MQGGMQIPLQVNLGSVPKEGPLAVSYNIDFTTLTSYVLDLTSIQQLARLSMIQTIFVDNSQSSVSLSMLMSGTNQTIVVPPFSQAYIPIVLTNKLNIVFGSTSGLVIPIQALNIAMNPYVWGVSGQPTFNDTGALIVSDPTLENAVNGNAFNVVDNVTLGDGTLQPLTKGTTAITGTLTATTAKTIFTGAPGWLLTGLRVSLSGDVTLAAAGDVNVIAAESGGTNIDVARASIGTTAATGNSGPIVLMDWQDAYITSKISASHFTLQTNVVPNAGTLNYTALYAITPYVGG